MHLLSLLTALPATEKYNLRERERESGGGDVGGRGREAGRGKRDVMGRDRDKDRETSIRIQINTARGRILLQDSLCSKWSLIFTI